MTESWCCEEGARKASPPASPARRAWDAVSPRLRAVLAFREASRTTTPTPPHDFADDGADEAPPRPPSQDPPPPRVALSDKPRGREHW